MEGVDGVIGIKDSDIVWMDDNTMEVSDTYYLDQKNNC